jgi:hypothetical protein
MRYQQINDIYRSLADQWRDLAESLRSLASDDPAATPRRNALETEANLCEQNVTPGVQPGYHQRALALRAGPQIDPSIQDAIRVAIAHLQAHNRHLQGAEANFTRYFSVPPSGKEDQSRKVRNCRVILRNLQQFIADNLQDLSLRQQELASPNTTVAANIGGFQSTVDDIASYPILTSELDIGPSPSAPSTPSIGGPNSLQRTVDTAVRNVLGYLPRMNDTRSFLLALNESFQVNEVDGHTEVTWIQRSYTGQTNLGGGVTGAQASLYTRSNVALDSALPLLDGLYPLLTDYDPQLAEAARAIVHSEFVEIVAELGVEGGPRIARVDQLFDSLLVDSNPDPNDPNKTINGGHLAYLKAAFGLERIHINTLDEEHDVTNFIALQDYATSIKESWEFFRDHWFGTDLGTQLVQLSRTLSVAAETVDEISFAMDSVFVGPAERQVAFFLDQKRREVLVADLLSWVSLFASEEAPRLVRDAGIRGAAAIAPTGQKLVDLVELLIKQIPYAASLPAGLRHPRIRPPLRELQTYLEKVVKLAKTIAP